MSVEAAESEIGAINTALERIKRSVEGAFDGSGVETHEQEILELDGRLNTVLMEFHKSTIDAADRAVLSREVKKAQAAQGEVKRLIEVLIARADWCNCEWYDDVVINPAFVASISDWMEENPYDPSRCLPDSWKVPEGVGHDNATLSRIHWREWRTHFIAGCIDPLFRVHRKDTKTPPYSSPFSPEDLPGKSFTAIKVFEKVRPYVFYNRNNGALYYRVLTTDGVIVTRRILSNEDERRAVFSKFWNDPAICSHRGRTTSHARFLVSFLGVSRLDVERFIKDTELYQISSKHKVIPKVVQPLVTSRPMEHLQADLVDMGAFSQMNAMRYILVMVDLFSKFLWARPLKEKNAIEVRNAIMDIFWNEGFPTIFQTDNGGEFVEIGRELDKRGIVVRRGRAYKPSSQGQVERTNRTLKQAFYMDFLASENYTWEGEYLQEKAYAYNTMVQSAIRKTPYELHRGVRPRNAPEFLDGGATSLLDIYVGERAKTILGEIDEEMPRAKRAKLIMADELLLMSGWGNEKDLALLPSLNVTSVRVAEPVKQVVYTPVSKPKSPGEDTLASGAATVVRENAPQFDTSDVPKFTLDPPEERRYNLRSRK
jgi:hypothetical protein